jgi:hypothetical protein
VELPSVVLGSSTPAASATLPGLPLSRLLSILPGSSPQLCGPARVEPAFRWFGESTRRLSHLLQHCPLSRAFWSSQPSSQHPGQPFERLGGSGGSMGVSAWAYRRCPARPAQAQA